MLFRSQSSTAFCALAFASVTFAAAIFSLLNWILFSISCHLFSRSCPFLSFFRRFSGFLILLPLEDFRRYFGSFLRSGRLSGFVFNFVSHNLFLWLSVRYGRIPDSFSFYVG